MSKKPSETAIDLIRDAGRIIDQIKGNLLILRLNRDMNLDCRALKLERLISV